MMKPSGFNKSSISRPYVISVDANIPDGAQVVVKVAGQLPGGTVWDKVYVNPQQQPLVSPQVSHLTLDLYPPVNSIAVPFVYKVVIEGDGRKVVFDAKSLASCVAGKPDYVVVDPVEVTQSQKLYLTQLLFGADWVIDSDIGRPWFLGVMGDAPGDSQVIVRFTTIEEDGTALEKQYHGPCREPIASDSFAAMSYDLRMDASSCARYTPFFNGVCIEGDGRYFYIANLFFDHLRNRQQAGDEKTSEKSQAVPIVKAGYRGNSPPPPQNNSSPPSYLTMLEKFAQGELKSSAAPIILPDEEGASFPLSDWSAKGDEEDDWSGSESFLGSDF